MQCTGPLTCRKMTNSKQFRFRSACMDFASLPESIPFADTCSFSQCMPNTRKRVIQKVLSLSMKEAVKENDFVKVADYYLF